jgi:uncharacterized ferredoxin-like protein
MIFAQIITLIASVAPCLLTGFVAFIVYYVLSKKHSENIARRIETLIENEGKTLIRMSYDVIQNIRRGAIFDIREVIRGYADQVGNLNIVKQLEALGI